MIAADRLETLVGLAGRVLILKWDKGAGKWATTPNNIIGSLICLLYTSPSPRDGLL